MSGRRFSLAIEDLDSSESPETPTNKPLSGFLVETSRPVLKKTTSFTTPPRAEEHIPQRRFSICDLNSFGDEDSHRLSDHSALNSCTFKNHHRRNSVAIKFSFPRSADTSVTSGDD